MRLYEISEQYRKFMMAIENDEVEAEAISDTLEAIRDTLEEKADNIACIIKELTAEAAAIKEEEQALAARRKAKENRVQSLKSYLAAALLDNDINKVESARNKISFRRSTSVDVADEQEFISWAELNGHNEYLTYKAPTINKTAIKNAILAGDKVEGAYIAEHDNIQIR